MKSTANKKLGIMEVDEKWIAGLLASVGAALAAVWLFFKTWYNQREAEHKRRGEIIWKEAQEAMATRNKFYDMQTEKLDQCEQANRDTQERLLELTRTVGTLQGRIEIMDRGLMKNLGEIKGLCENSDNNQGSR